MTPQEAYKIGFMMKCAELGLEPEEAAGNLIKYGTPAALLSAMKWIGLGALAPAIAAAGSFGYGAGTKLLGGTMDVAKTGLKGGLQFGLPAALFGPPIGGLVLGNHLANITSPKVNVKDMQRSELREEYERNIAVLRRHLRSRGVKV